MCWPNGKWRLHTTDALPEHKSPTNVVPDRLLSPPYLCVRARVNPTRDKTGRLDELLQRAAGSSSGGKKGWFGL
jgi:hypothetical protein